MGIIVRVRRLISNCTGDTPISSKGVLRYFNRPLKRSFLSAATFSKMRLAVWCIVNYFDCELNNSYLFLNIYIPKDIPMSQGLPYAFISVETVCNYFLRRRHEIISRYLPFRNAAWIGLLVGSFSSSFVIFPNINLKSILFSFHPISHVYIQFYASTRMTLSGCQNSFQDKHYV